MNILFAASELTPYVTTGGLGDVAAALPAELRAAGHSVSVVLPFYRTLRETLPEIRPTSLTLPVALGDMTLTANIWQGVSRDGVTLFAVERDEFFDRYNLYGANGSDYFDNAARFIFFSKVVLALAGKLQPRPTIIHANDWQTALIPVLVRAEQLPLKTVLTIHNLAFQGIFPPAEFALTNLPGFYLKPHMLEYYGRMNLLKGGIMSADVVTTVSPRYAQEILTEQHGCGLAGALQTRQDVLTGILNGIDTKLWDPANDRWIAQSYDVKRLDNKRKNKEALVKFFDWGDVKQPLIGLISRLVEQKGIELLLEILPDILVQGANVVVLGSGEASYEDALMKLMKQHPQQLAVHIGFDEKLAHRIEAGCDIFLMPSRFEPCGLNQFYSMRYGTVPVVHDVGGLSDSVQEGVTGFKFSGYNKQNFKQAVFAALELFKNKRQWTAMQEQGMSQDHSWRQRLPEYEKIYAKLTVA